MSKVFAGMKPIKIKGYAGNLTTDVNQLVWPHNMEYIYGSVSETLYLSSSDNGDDQDYKVTGVDANYVYQEVEVTSSGQTGVKIGEDNTWRRVFSIENIGDTNNAGDIYIGTESAPTGGIPNDNNIRGMIETGKNKSEMALYTVPNKKRIFIKKIILSEAGADDGSSLMSLNVRPFGKVFKRELSVSLLNGVAEIDLEEPIIVESKSDIEIQVVSGASNPGKITVLVEAGINPLFYAGE